jgi:putative redox protein
MEARGVWNAGFETRLDDGRGHVVTVDLPVDEDGTNAGTSALELAVLSLAGCVTTIFSLIAKRRRLTFDGLRVALTADRPPGAPTIVKVRGTVEVNSEAARDDVETVLRLTLRTCPVGVLFEKAGIPVVVDCIVSPPRSGTGSHLGGVSIERAVTATAP